MAVAGGGSDDPSGSGDRAEQSDTKGADSEGVTKDSGGSDGGSGSEGSEGGSGGGAAPADPSAPGTGGDSAPAEGTPAAAVNDFYQRAAKGDYDGAWALATPRAREKLGGFAGFSAGQSSLDSISFPTLKGKEKGDTATVQLKSQAVHTDRIDRCTGSIDLVRSGGTWMLDDFHIASCAKSPRP